jgi:hypothetical protein
MQLFGETESKTLSTMKGATRAGNTFKFELPHRMQLFFVIARPWYNIENPTYSTMKHSYCRAVIRSTIKYFSLHLMFSLVRIPKSWILDHPISVEHSCPI